MESAASRPANLSDANPPSPRVAVIVPAYNVAHLVGEALASLQAQSLGDWECVVVDDGAPDDVALAVAPFLADPRIRLLHTSHLGVSAARNAAIAASSAPLIALLDGDDRLRPDYLETLAPLLESDPAIRIATCNGWEFGEVAREAPCFTRRQGKGDGQTGTLDDVLDRSFEVYIGSMFRRADFDRIGGFDPQMAHAEDFDLWVRLLQLGGTIHYIDRVLGEYRVRSNSASAHGARMLVGNIRVYEKAQAALAPEATEQPTIARLLAQSREALAFEHAIDRVVDGDTEHGLVQLRAVRGRVTGPVWDLSFALWHWLPSLARPMLRWRRRANRRGNRAKLRSLIKARAA